MSVHTAVVAVPVLITVNDESAIARCVDNHDENGVPQPDVRGGTGWRNNYYPLTTRERVLSHFAFNAVANHVTDASSLDGWADLPAGAVVMELDHADTEVIEIDGDPR